MDPERYLDPMGEAINEASKALVHGDVPVGAVALLDDKIIARRHNEREMRQNPISHAEILLLEELSGSFASWRLEEITVVVTLEPCFMCCGALMAARVKRLVFGAFDQSGGACGSLYNLCCDPRLNHEIELISGVRELECSAILTDFFQKRRLGC